MNAVLWNPTRERIADSRLVDFACRVSARYGLPPFDSYAALHRWSLKHRGAFWTEVAHFGDFLGDLGRAAKEPEAAYVPGPHMTETGWFPEAQFNFAENLLRPRDVEFDTRFAASPAIFFRSETGEERIISHRQLLDQSLAFAAWLEAQGVVAGDRIAAVIPNIPEAVIAMLGTAAIGAIWSSCSPDFGEDAILDRFGQIEPKIVITAAHCTYGGKSIDLLARVRPLIEKLPTVMKLVVSGTSSEECSFEAITAQIPESRDFPRFPFSHPLFILYSSGTTGVPKCIVHGAGGTLLQHLKEHLLHTDVHSGDRMFYYTTTGWMMWNWLVSALAAKATIVLFDGSPFTPAPNALFQLAHDWKITQFGAGAKYYAALEKAGVKPRTEFELSELRTILSTGSPLLPESFDYLYRDVKSDVQVASISGGTDIVSCFVLGSPITPVRRGEIAVKGLGMDVQVRDAEGRKVLETQGELVCATAFPSMPVGFWNDPEKKKYLGSYFSTFENIWCHGDYAEELPSGGFIIYGRSDTTLNPGGVRIGTAEIYRQVETVESIAESAAVALRKEGDESIILFVKMKPGEQFTEEIEQTIKQRLRERCSPRHVPAKIVAVPDLPRTVSGKISETAIRNQIHGLPVANTGALANPESLAFFERM